MKYLLLLIVCFVAYSCDDNTRSEGQVDVSIEQVSYYLAPNKYDLKTFVCVEWGKYKDNSDDIFPYSNVIQGTYDYIKKHKLAEYKKADSVLHTKRINFIRDSIYAGIIHVNSIKDSIKSLNLIKP